MLDSNFFKYLYEAFRLDLTIVVINIKVKIFIHVEDEKVTAWNRTYFFLAVFCQITMMSHYL